MSTRSEQDQMNLARTLIEQKRYTEARDILTELDNSLARDWVFKIDQILLGDPFQSTVPALPQQRGPSLFQSAVSIMTSHDWEVVTFAHNVAYFKKRKGPNSLVAGIVVVLFGLIGCALVCLSIATSRFVTVSFTELADGSLVMTKKNGEFPITDLRHVEEMARSVKRGPTYIGASAGAVLVTILVYLCIVFFYTPIAYF